MSKKNEVDKKPIFSIYNAIIYLVFIFIIIVCIWNCFCIDKIFSFIQQKIELLRQEINLIEFSPISLVSLQASISFLSITIMNIILPERQNRILGLTYQNIFFKRNVFKFFNAADSIMYLLFMLITNTILGVVSIVADNVCVQNISKCSFLVILMLSFILVFYMLYLCMIAKFKKSRIYHYLYHRCKTKELYNSILEELIIHPLNLNIEKKDEKEDMINYDYYVEEIKILNIMKDDVDSVFVEEDFNKNMQKRINGFSEEENVVKTFMLDKDKVIKILEHEIQKRKDILSNKINEKKEALIKNFL